MGWQDLEFKERWSMVVGAVHAFASVGMVIVAIVGFSSVTPIIRHEVQQRAHEEALAEFEAFASRNSFAGTFVGEVLFWWTDQVRAYQRILELTARVDPEVNVSFEVVESTPFPGVPGHVSDSLVVTAIDADGHTEKVEVPVNDDAMPPSQYIQYKINQGALAALEASKRRKVENGIIRYMRSSMLRKPSPARVHAGMSLQEVRAEVSRGQPARLDATPHIVALKGVIDSILAD